MIKVFRQYVSPRKVIFVVGEGVLIFTAVTLSSFLAFGQGIEMSEMLQTIWPKIVLILFITQLALYFNDLYEFKLHENMIELASRLIQAIGITTIGLAVIYFMWPEMIIGRWIFFASLVLLLFFLVSWRLLYSLAIRKRVLSEKAVLLGAGELAEDIWAEIKGRGDISYDVRFVLSQEQEKREGDGNRFGHVPQYFGFEGLSDLVEREGISSIIVGLDEKRGVMPYDELLKCKLKGVNILDGESFYERITEKVLVEKINPSWLIFSDGFVKSKSSRLVKRLVGLTMSSILLVFFSPVMLIVAVIIKLTSPGPVLFSQERVGEFGRVFTLYKFRSMRVDAEKETGPVWATEDDPRVTKIGRIIRKLRIDELPQLWNVFKGDMSFVGPRPEREFFVEQLKKKVPYFNERASVKPGVTGWAQIRYPYGATEEDALEKLKYDLYYIKNMSLVMDLIIMFHTAKTVLLGRGAR
jgi:sugar transferase (PEP-CTERM system associated)